MQDDPIVNEVRRARERLAESFDFDVGAIFADLRKRQAELGSRLVRLAKKNDSKRSTGAARDSTALRPGR